MRQLEAEEALRAERSCSARKTGASSWQENNPHTQRESAREREEDRASIAAGLIEGTKSRHKSEIWIEREKLRLT